MSWARDGSDLVTWFTGREQLSELWRNHMHAIKCIATCKPSLAQLNLDSPQHALSNGYRVWGVKVTLGYEGKRSRVTRTSDRGGPAHGDRCLSWARSPHHLLRFCRSLFVLLGTCFARIVGALFATKVSFGTSPFGRIVPPWPAPVGGSRPRLVRCFPPPHALPCDLSRLHPRLFAI